MNPIAQASAKAAATKAGGSMPGIGLLCPANPTRITPVLVTAGAGLVAAPAVSLAADEDGLGVAGEAVAGLDVMPPEEVIEPPAFPVFPPLSDPPVAMGIGGGEVRAGGGTAGVVCGGRVVPGAVVGMATPPETTMTAEGLPAPQAAVTA
jgi:hypothetical protein